MDQKLAIIKRTVNKKEKVNPKLFQHCETLRTFSKSLATDLKLTIVGKEKKGN